MKHKKVVILGSTGSIGRNVLKVAAGFPEHFTVVGMTAGRNIDLLRQQIETFSPRVVSVAEEDAALKLKTLLEPGCQTEIVWGQKGNEQVACLTEADMVVSAIVGAAGLLPTFTAIRSGKDIALANKFAAEILGRSLDELAPPTRDLLQLIKKMIDEYAQKTKKKISETVLND